MRIGIEAQRIFRKKKHGMDIYALELIRQLQQTDRLNQYFIFVKPGEDHCLQETENFKIVEVNGLTYADWEQISLPLAISEYNLDVLHCTSNTAPLFAGVPTMITLHDIIYLNQNFSGGSLYQRLGHYYRKWIVPEVFKKAKKVFTVSNFEKEHIDNYFGETDKVEVIYNGVSSKFHSPENHELEEIRKALSLPEKYLFFLGNTVPKKNMPGLLEAYVRYRDTVKKPLPLVIAESSESDINAILQKIKRPDVRKHLHLTGYVNHDWLPGLYAMAELFLYPSLRESFGIPIIEAMSCGTPVITSNTSSMPEVAGGCAILCDPYDVADMAQQMISFDQMGQSDKDILIAEGLAHSTHFTWEKTAHSVLNKYRGTNVQFLSFSIL